MRGGVRLKELLRTRLIECGWRDQLKVQCKEVVREKGLENVTVDDLVTVITPKGRGQAADPPGNTLNCMYHHVNATCPVAQPGGVKGRNFTPSPFRSWEPIFDSNY